MQAKTAISCQQPRMVQRGVVVLRIKRVFGRGMPIVQRENRGQAGIIQPDKAAGGGGKIQSITIGKAHGHRAIQLEYTAVLNNRVTITAVQCADIDPDIDGEAPPLINQ